MVSVFVTIGCFSPSFLELLYLKVQISQVVFFDNNSMLVVTHLHTVNAIRLFEALSESQKMPRLKYYLHLFGAKWT